jgi:exodeoxyribonuclease VII small subunit|tara:strand:+ start:8551 stop:8754 length:204 start_codon:yes stop_codon:yes gene_type:complete
MSSLKINEIKKLSYEEAMTKLEQVVENLSSNNVKLDNMVELYQEGKALHDHCSKLLNEAKLKIEEVN